MMSDFNFAKNGVSNFKTSFLARWLAGFVRRIRFFPGFGGQGGLAIGLESCLEANQIIVTDDLAFSLIPVGSRINDVDARR
jgi:hypothetical protein